MASGGEHGVAQVARQLGPAAVGQVEFEDDGVRQQGAAVRRGPGVGPHVVEQEAPAHAAYAVEQGIDAGLAEGLAATPAQPFEAPVHQAEAHPAHAPGIVKAQELELWPAAGRAAEDHARRGQGGAFARQAGGGGGR